MNSKHIPSFLRKFSRNSISGWQKHDGKTDMLEGFRNYHVWMIWGWHDIKQRYRRSVLGPFWFTLTTLIMVGALGFLYSQLLRQEVSDYLPYLGIGLVLWQFISTTTNEACSTFIISAHIIKQIRIPLTTYVCRMVWRNFIILLHSLPVVLLLMVFLGHQLRFSTVLAIPGLLVILLNAIWIGIVLGVLSSRFRDIAPIIGNLFQVFFFITPVMWRVVDLKERAWIAGFNPLYHYIEIIRAPILGIPLSESSWVWSILILILGYLLAHHLLVRYRDRVSYWL